ncbi:MAG: hypothetical protein ACKVT1_14220 [Dehalococcoidia bacterium]
MSIPSKSGRQHRAFFESLVTDNVGIGRPDQVAVVFARQVRKNTPGIFRTRIFSPGTEVKIDLLYKHSRVKQYLKEGRALRVETVINDPTDIGVQRRLQHLPELQEKARAVNQRLLMIERAGQGCAIGSALFERIQLQVRAKEPERCASGINAPWPWPVPSACLSTPSPASATRASGALSPRCLGWTTPPGR